MGDISFAVQSGVFALLLSAMALQPKGRAAVALRIACALFAIYLIVRMFIDIPIRVAIDPALAQHLNGGSNLLAMAALIWMMVSSYHADRKPTQA